MPRDGSETRERILQVAERLMTELGYNATSLDQVIKESSTSKGSFFHHFSSKADLARHVTERYAESDLGQLAAGLAAVEGITDPAARVIEFVRFYEEAADDLMAEQSACLYATVLAERQLTGVGIDGVVARAALGWRAAIVELLRPALARRPGADIDVDALADHLYTTFEGAFILCRTLGDPSCMRSQLRVLRQLLESLLVTKRRPRRAG